jgi:hypothetical protein
MDIMYLLVHSSLRMTQVYARGTPEVLSQAVESLAEKRGEILEFGRKAG